MDHRSYRADERLNQLSDRDEAWGPLVFMRPAKHQLMSPARVIGIAALLGGFYGLLGDVAVRLAQRGDAVGHSNPCWMPLLFTALCFVFAQLSVVGAWNRRARLLSRRMGWSELTGRPQSRLREDEHAAE